MGADSTSVPVRLPARAAPLSASPTASHHSGVTGPGRRRTRATIEAVRPFRARACWRIAQVLLAVLGALATTRVPAGAQEAIADGTWRFVAAPVAGWHFFGPVRASVTALIGAGTGDLSIPAPGSKFLLLIAEPGLRGGRASLAGALWGRWSGGLVARGSVLRFWGGAPHRTYVGGELQWIVSVLPLGVRVGAFRPQRADASGARRTLWMADLSIMY